MLHLWGVGAQSVDLSMSKAYGERVVEVEGEGRDIHKGEDQGTMDGLQSSQVVQPSAPQVEGTCGIRFVGVPTYATSSDSEGEDDNDVPNCEQALELPRIERAIALDPTMERWLSYAEEAAYTIEEIVN